MLKHFEFDEDSYYIVNWIKRKSNNTNIIHMCVCICWLGENTEKVPSIFIGWEIYDRKCFSQTVLISPRCDPFTPSPNTRTSSDNSTHITFSSGFWYTILACYVSLFATSLFYLLFLIHFLCEKSWGEYRPQQPTILFRESA